ncbi:MAG: PQQ-binding-like beta-propeller repeat protein [Candidatus Eremiobacteraeota bacterium]|nr:PQQ-binding-like beta-propeller repeat protein [Candidatus Eremiobacteraeota bacterium]MBV8459322.1 PQQ-binding-like beta-propeller repeat protein [Candidatus Eremiobacteraeota bacterium]
MIPGKTYAGNRVTALDEITPENVGGLKKAWVTSVKDDGEEEASPIVWNGTVYVSTAHDNVLALDGTTGALRWAFPYNPAYELQYAVNRGVGLEDGRLYIVTQDCRLIAIDASAGKEIYDVPACHDTSASWYSMAAYLYKGKVIVGTSGGDLGGSGLISAFSAQDGSRLWDWHTVAQPGQPGHNSWPGNSYVHGGAAVWSGLSIDQSTDTLYAAPGNPGPNLTEYGRKGADLYADTVVALDISGSTPRLKWYYKVSPNDVHDNDPSMPPVLFTGTIDGSQRQLLAVGDKAGDFAILDRTTGKPVARLAVSDQKNIFTTAPTTSGTFACPNHGGGIEWNGGSYDVATNYFYIPSTQECAIWKILYRGAVPYVPGQAYSAGPLPKRRPATGLLTAIDVAAGKPAWTKRFPYAAQGGVLITRNGLLFTTDTGGDIYALDPKTGQVLWHDDVGSAIVAPISAYRGSDGHEYLVVEAGEAGNQQTPNLPPSAGGRIVAYSLNPSQTVTNGTSGQPAVTAATSEKSESSSIVTATVPYTMAQVSAGSAVYARYCLSCHGAKLQGVAAPALTGPGFAHANLDVAQIYAVVAQQMPLTAPGSLSKSEYAAVMAYVLAYDCIKPSGANESFPTSVTPQLSSVRVGGQTCPR